ncbi:MAG: dienelactone hydrolase family protein [Melioribacteraceae bacterium]|nr:dienelactone hydrolase family protein [Melioribacteraceae bacterium]MCF8356359.1 dienelactone hydrolase family protein [Melioribacteraceae bacterium]MCF8395798.1 dienelactone hydrolase family protein [Melioribacteraceae bacterium]MCF8420663.1 dienelactone hydrolase family protein [Melioribacteraceae bacterium]
MLKLNDTIKPHTGDEIYTRGADLINAESAMIMLHGRGGSSQSMIDLSHEFNSDNMIFIAPQADNFTWYPYRFIEEREVNQPGIKSGMILIDKIIDSLVLNGIVHTKIYLLGFSQGACLALDYAARNPKGYGGVFVLSGGLIGKSVTASEYIGDMERTPVFFGCSDNDFHIPESRITESAEILKSLNADVTKRIYRNLGHTINQDEIDFINEIIKQK